MLGISDGCVIRRPAADSIIIARLTLCVPVNVIQRVVQMRHQLCLNIPLSVELVAPAFCHILLHYFIVTSAFVLQHSNHAQHREFFFAFRRRGVHLLNQAVKEGGQVVLRQQLQVGLLHIGADVSALIQTEIGKTAAIAPVAVGQGGVTHRV